MMVPVPIRSRIPEHLLRLGKDQVWLAHRAKMKPSQVNDYATMDYMLGMVKAKLIARILKLKCIDDLYVWEWREE